MSSAALTTGPTGPVPRAQAFWPFWGCWEQYNLLLDISLRYFITFSFKLLPEELLPGKKGQRRREKYM